MSFSDFDKPDLESLEFGSQPDFACAELNSPIPVFDEQKAPEYFCEFILQSGIASPPITPTQIINSLHTKSENTRNLASSTFEDSQASNKRFFAEPITEIAPKLKFNHADDQGVTL